MSEKAKARVEKKLGKYELIAELGHGGMADVYLAIARGPAGLGFSKFFVIKKLREHLARDQDFVSMLVDEARIAARLNHPNVVQTVEIADQEGEYFLVMEYLDGQPLRRILQRVDSRGGMPQALRYLAISDMLSGLHHAHELQDFDGTPLRIVHRDVSPHNVLVSYEGQVKVVDFGIAKASGRISETRHGIIKGKAPFMAPEQALGAQLDRRADIFAAGVMLWETATGKRMWHGVADADILRRLIKGAIPYSPIEANPNVPKRIDEICRKALAFVVENRYESAAALQADLEDFLIESGLRASNRELGKYVSTLFESHRAEARAIIDMRLAQLHAASPESLRAVPMALLKPPPASSDDVTSSEVTSGSGISVPVSGPAVTASKALSTLESGSAKHATPRRRLGRILGLIALAVVALSIGGWSLLRWNHSSPVLTPQQPEAVSQPPPPAEVFLILRATPPETRFSVDNGPWLENPFSGHFARDGAAHVVRAQAPGFTTKSETIYFDDDRALRFSLARSDATSTTSNSK